VRVSVQVGDIVPAVVSVTEGIKGSVGERIAGEGDGDICGDPGNPGTLIPAQDTNRRVSESVSNRFIILKGLL